MKEAEQPSGEGFTAEDMNDVIMALCPANEAEKEASFTLFSRGRGKINLAEFKSIVPLLGEDHTQEEVNAMFSPNPDPNSRLTPCSALTPTLIRG